MSFVYNMDEDRNSKINYRQIFNENWTVFVTYLTPILFLPLPLILDGQV